MQCKYMESSYYFTSMEQELEYLFKKKLENSCVGNDKI